VDRRALAFLRCVQVPAWARDEILARLPDLNYV
jgi:hypothetical protein